MPRRALDQSAIMSLNVRPIPIVAAEAACRGIFRQHRRRRLVSSLQHRPHAACPGDPPAPRGTSPATFADALGTYTCLVKRCFWCCPDACRDSESAFLVAYAWMLVSTDRHCAYIVTSVAIALAIQRIRVISMRYSLTPFRFFDFAFMILSSHTPSAASLMVRSSILESVFECLFRRSLSQLSQTRPT